MHHIRPGEQNFSKLFAKPVTLLDSSAVRVYLGLRHQPPYSGTIYAWGNGSPLVFAKWGDSDPYAVRI